jgi:hypothetical protein
LKIGEPIEYLITLPAASHPADPVQIRCRGKIVRFARKAEVAATLERYEFQR